MNLSESELSELEDESSESSDEPLPSEDELLSLRSTASKSSSSGSIST